ncbi:MAG: ABC transporter ATP-binding protein [Spirochaetia bacterium]|jgi:branched-chain amino acid transport system ATP-binding protein|nr:ABC transporter ATP-binding protein [Spirochaetia bacterium]
MVQLSIKDVNVWYGYIQALNNVSLEANQGEIVSIIGSNGAGKTSLLNSISSLIHPVSGAIRFEKKDVPRKPCKVVKMGIVQVPEGRKTFSGLSIQDNLLVGGYQSSKGELGTLLKHQYSLFPILEERKRQYAGTLSGGEQQMLAISRGLMSKPKLLLLDEPSLGLAPLIVNQVFDIIRQIRDSGITIVLVEQNAKKALSIADRAYVLENGEIKISGTGKELLSSDTVKKAYLGA